MNLRTDRPAQFRERVRTTNAAASLFIALPAIIIVALVASKFR